MTADPNAPLRILTTEILPFEILQTRAERDLGFPLHFEQHDFVTAQRLAAMQPERYDVYDQCFHNLDIVWHWRAIQPIEVDRIETWPEMEELSRFGKTRSAPVLGQGDAPVTKLYVQSDATLGPVPTPRISMLPTVHNFDSFAVNETATGIDADQEVTSWAELLEPRWHGHAALVDEPAIGAFDLAMALKAAGQIALKDIGAMSVEEIDALIEAGRELSAQRHLAPFWRTASEATERFMRGEITISSLWSPSVVALKARGLRVRQAVPVEGYRGWHGGMCLARHLEGDRLDRAYAWLNWFLSGWAGAVLARQGYYMSVQGRVRQHLHPDEWDYWYEGRPAARALPDTAGCAAIRPGEMRSGGSYHDRAARVAVWNTTMNEHNYLVRRWSELVAANAARAGRGRKRKIAE